MANAQAISGSENSKDLQGKVDSGDTFTLDARALTQFVTRYLTDEIDAQELEKIGDMLEGAELIEFVGPGADGIIAQVLFEISPPGKTGAITKEAADRWLRLLGD
jgi:DNA-binding MurR/RpiR family transcriptional regulator